MVIACAGCGWPAPPRSATPFRCPRAGTDDVDHVLVRRLDPSAAWPDERDPNPFLRYRRFLASYDRAEDDAHFVDVVTRLDEAVAAVDGRGFTVTPFRWADALGAWVKDETGNVAGSHKGRHLMGLAIWLEMAGVEKSRQLAIASCGNAALAAGVTARASGRPLSVFVPPWADDRVLARLGDLGAELHVCPREPADPPGDPCIHRFREAVAAGAVPFSCQGPDNGLTIDGGRILAYELADAEVSLDALVVQAGGGALASAVAQGLHEAVVLGRLPREPAVHVVQPEANAPLVRAWQRARETAEETPRTRRAHRRDFMWPWEPVGTSVATGILDDEAYDWASVVDALLRTGGTAIAVGEDDLVRANELARSATGIDVDPTGSAGLAGLVALRETHAASPGAGAVSPDARAAVLFTG
jgi:threonine synthase